MATDVLQIPITDYAYLEGVSWGEYESLLEQAGEQRLRFTYDDKRLEITTRVFEREWLASLIGSMIDLTAIVLGIPFRSGGSTRMKQKSKKTGLEPDGCYWFQHEEQMRGKLDYDIEVDLPPELVLEIDVTRSAIKRMPIYAAMCVPEVWRFKGEQLNAHVLQPNGAYKVSDHSRVFPFLAMAELQQFLERAAHTDQATLAREFMAWVDKELKPRVQAGRKNGKRGK
jgi:Uma2 family endonuclease